LSAKKYNIIYADPPWSYKDKLRCGQRGSSFKYPTLTAKSIKELPVSNLAAENCVLFLWITPPLYPLGLEVMKAWGFEYKTLAFTWVKWNKKANSPFFGLGHGTRANAEFVLRGTRGKLERKDKAVSQIIFNDFLGFDVDLDTEVIVTQVGAHSAKPQGAREGIERLYGDVPRIELFARERVEGWDATGLDFDGVDIRDLLI